MAAKEAKKTIEHLAEGVQQKARFYASAGREKLVTTLRKGQKLVEEKKSHLASAIGKTKNKMGFH